MIKDPEFFGDDLTIKTPQKSHIYDISPDEQKYRRKKQSN
jgi:hypothetical protein